MVSSSYRDFGGGSDRVQSVRSFAATQRAMKDDKQESAIFTLSMIALLVGIVFGYWLALRGGIL